jgi:hypothetical protein
LPRLDEADVAQLFALADESAIVDNEAIDEEPRESPIDMPVISASAITGVSGERLAESRAARAASSPSFFRQLVGVIGGGIVGLAIGYIILLWIGGPERDFLELGPRLPRWAVPAGFHAAADLEPQQADEQDGRRAPPADWQDQIVDDLAGDVPNEPDGRPPEPPSSDASVVDSSDAIPVVDDAAVVDPPDLTTAELESTLMRAVDSRLGLVVGELIDPSTRSIKTAAYRTFAALAEAYAFALPTDGREVEHIALRGQAEQLFRDALANTRMFDQIGPLAAEWIDAPERESGGIVAAGVVIASHLGIEQQAGITVELSGTQRNVPVVGPAGIQAPIGGHVLVVGSIIERPAENIRGYIGSAPLVIWAALVIPL